MEAYLEDWVRALQNSPSSGAAMDAPMTWAERIRAGLGHDREIVGKVWPYILLGVVYVFSDFGNFLSLN